MNGFEDVEGRADSHQVARGIRREERRRQFGEILPLVLRFADGKTPDRKSIERHRGQRFRAFSAKVSEAGALDDAEEGLRGVPSRIEAALRPAMGEFHRPARGSFVGNRRNALIEHHHDVAADRALDANAFLRGEQMHFPVDVTLEPCPFLRDRPRVRERENLKAAGIGEDGAIPVHEGMDAAHSGEDFRSRAEHEVIRIREEHAGAGGFQAFDGDSFHGRLGSDRHEDRGEHFPVEGREAGRTGSGPGGVFLESERESFHIGESSRRLAAFARSI